MASVDPSLVDLTIRTYCSADHDAVVQLYLDGMISYSYEGEDEASQELWRQVRKASVESDLADIEGVYLASGGHFWVAAAPQEGQQQKIVGMVGLQRHSADVGELRRMSVKEGYRRLGLGRGLLTFLEHWAGAHEFKRVELSTGLDMTSAVEFYKAQGYSLTHTTVFAPGMLHEEAHFAKELSAEIYP